MNETIDTGELSPSSREASPLLDGESLLTLQVHAFLEASEDVDIDQETVEDLMRILSEHQNNGNSQTEGPNQVLTNNRTNGNEETLRGSEGKFPTSAHPLSVFINCGCFVGEQEWTEQERKQLSHHLKERGQFLFKLPLLYPLFIQYLGMASFIKEYVVQRNITIPRLLEAFDVSLVSLWLSFSTC